MSGAFRPLKPNEISVRIGQVKQGAGFSLLLYKDSRCDMQLLDETVGAMNWKVDFKTAKDMLVACISIWDSEKGQWIAKENSGSESEIESEKGYFSDSMKRAGFCWGIGRELYNTPFIWIKGQPNKNRGAYWVGEIEYDGDSVSFLTILARGDNYQPIEVYRYGRKASATDTIKAVVNNTKKKATAMTATAKKEESTANKQRVEDENDENTRIANESWGDSKESEVITASMEDLQGTSIEVNPPTTQYMVNAIRMGAHTNELYKRWVMERLQEIGKQGAKIQELPTKDIEYIYKEAERRDIL